MSDIDQEFIEYVVKSLVGNPDAVHIDRRVDEKGVLLELTVNPEDLGRVIGKRGATAQSLRTLLRALGTKNDARYNLKIMDNGPERDDRVVPSDNGVAPAVATVSSDDNAAVLVPTSDDRTVTTINDDLAVGVAADAIELPTPVIGQVPATSPTAALAGETADIDAVAAEPNSENQTSDRLRRTRAELADLDDLDV